MGRRPRTAADPELTIDLFLGGKVEAAQPASGHHRSGLEAVFLSAAIPAKAEGLLIDLGAGAGVAGFCAAARCPRLNVLLVERDPLLVVLAAGAAGRTANEAFGSRIRVVEADIRWGTRILQQAGLTGAHADFVVFNPPFHVRERVRTARDPARVAAHVLQERGLDPWFRNAVSLLKPEGVVVTIFPPDRLDDLLEAAIPRFGALELLPIHPRAGLPAHRVLLRGRKGRRAGIRIRPGFALHGESGSHYLPAAEAILRQGAGLAEAAPGWPADPE